MDVPLSELTPDQLGEETLRLMKRLERRLTGGRLSRADVSGLAGLLLVYVRLTEAHMGRLDEIRGLCDRSLTLSPGPQDDPGVPESP